ncbi:MAG: hypothetical protein MUF84_09475 [Anaerolineae bacterium]|nr:hypothetical protein [Anaerolineae bacterium]
MIEHNFARAEVVVVTQASFGPGRHAVLALVEEVERRTGIRWTVTDRSSEIGGATVYISDDASLDALPAGLAAAVGDLEAPGPEGFRLVTVAEPIPTVLVVGHDDRGILYGVGRLLRRMEMRPGSVTVPADLRLSTTPFATIRGHQLGYRPKNNTFDAWTPAQFEQYIRELAFFGANSIEILPPRTDDALSNDLMPVPPTEMVVALGEIIDRYGLDVWLWYPNVGKDYGDPACVQAELNERADIFSCLKRLDHVFIPGGDPGDLAPGALFAWSAQVAEVLHVHHPEAKVWLSPQAFRPDDDWLEEFFAQVDQAPDWLGGIVFAPWVPVSLPELRARIPARYPIRRYPDITHSMQCQYPVPEWDLALALTHGREGINPRPVAMKELHNRLRGHAVGSITYSEGINDDVNKVVWADQDWDPGTPVAETLRDYVRLFIGPDSTSRLSQGFLALEENWRGPLVLNAGVEATLQHWQFEATHASEGVLDNYRFQMGLLRAYYDAYIRRRLIYESELLEQAYDALRSTAQIGVRHALSRAEAVLDCANTTLVAQEMRVRLRAWCDQLADALQASISLQSSVSRHGAQSWGRGAFMDGIDLPLNDGPWLGRQLSLIRVLPDEAAQLAAVDSLLRRADPGPGGRYLDLGAPGSLRYALNRAAWERDPGYLVSPFVGFDTSGIGLLHHEGAACGDAPVLPIARLRQLGTSYETPLTVRLDRLEPSAYLLRVAYGVPVPGVALIVNGILLAPQTCGDDDRVCAYRIAADMAEAGELTLTWRAAPGERGVRVAELWLVLDQAGA